MRSFVFVTLLVHCSTVFGEEKTSAPSASPLSQTVQASTKSFRPLDPNHVVVAKAELDSALSRLTNFLSKGGAEYEKDWKEKLAFDTIQQELHSNQPDVVALMSAQSRFYQLVEGLEQPVFLDTRAAVGRYIDALRLASVTDVKQHVEIRLRNLAASLDRYEHSPTDDDAVMIGDTIGWLRAADQVPELVEAVAAKYTRPNGHVSINRRAVLHTLERPIHQSTKVNDFLFGTSVRGSVIVDGHVSAELVPSKSRANCDVNLSSAVVTNTTSQRRSVTVRTRAATSLRGTKTVFIDDQGLHTLPATARASTRATTTGISARGPLIRRIALRRVNKLQPQMESVTSQRAARQIESELNGQLGEQITTANRFYHGRIRDPGIVKGVFPSFLQFSSTSDALEFSLFVGNNSQLGAASVMHPYDRPHDIEMSVHQSLMNNAAEILYAGKELRDKEFQVFLRAIVGEIPREYRLGTHMQCWSVRLARRRPIRFRFRNQLVEVRLHATSVRRGTELVEGPVMVVANYRVMMTRFGLNMVRVGEVEYSKPGGQDFGAGDQQLLAFVKRKFDAFLSKDVYLEGLIAPPGAQWEKLGKYQLNEIQIDDGWALFGYDLPRGPAPPIAVVSRREARAGDN